MLIPRQPRDKKPLIGQILRINVYISEHSEGFYTGYAAAYGLHMDGPWGPMTGDVQAFGDVVLEHMLSEGANYREIAEAGRAALNALNAYIPTTAAVTEAVGNSSTETPPSTSG